MGRAKNYTEHDSEFLNACLKYYEVEGRKPDYKLIAGIMDREAKGVECRVYRMITPPKPRVKKTTVPRPAIKKPGGMTYETLQNHLGERVDVTVDRVMDYGAFCRIVGTDIILLCHISNMRPFFITDIDDVAKPGQRLKADIMYQEKTEKYALTMTSAYLEEE